ncbi:Zinc finger BED domain-containing protein 5 [Dictyocoela muelleri]|nr:Zinc finger BED domain-containing protein 5 [Dictyocoela muelleri]
MKTSLTNIRSDVFYLNDIFEKLNILNKQLQNTKCNLLLSQEIISGFIRKIEVYSINIRRHNFNQFNSLNSISNELSSINIQNYLEHLEQLRVDMKLRFDDLLNLVIPKWIIDPFTFNVENVDVLLQVTLIDLQNDLTAKMCFENEKYNFWFKNKMTEKYPLLWEEAKLFYIAFPSSYLVENGFSRVNDLITHKRNRLDLTKMG